MHIVLGQICSYVMAHIDPIFYLHVFWSILFNRSYVVVLIISLTRCLWQLSRHNPHVWACGETEFLALQTNILTRHIWSFPKHLPVSHASPKISINQSLQEYSSFILVICSSCEEKSIHNDRHESDEVIQYIEGYYEWGEETFHGLLVHWVCLLHFTANWADIAP